jgi:hypothetical protein
MGLQKKQCFKQLYQHLQIFITVNCGYFEGGCVCVPVSMCVFSDIFSKFHMKILLGDFHANVGREDLFKLAVGNESLHEISTDNGVKVVNFSTSKNLAVKDTMVPHRSIHNYTWMSSDGKSQIRIDHILIGEGIQFT